MSDNIWQHHDDLSLAKQAMDVDLYGWLKQLAAVTKIPYQTIRSYHSHPEKLDHASATTVNKIADFMLHHWYENQTFNVENLPLKEQIKTYQQWLRYSRMYSPEATRRMQNKLAELRKQVQNE